ncbi:MAG: extracellular solute-binding protein, partial [bacterium]
FIQGSSAFFLGYSYHLPVIRARAPKINLGITKVPQITGNPEVNFANYWMWTVSKKAKNADLAWHFVNFLTNATEAPKYLEAAKRPAARRALLTSQLEDEDIGVFSSQVLTAKSWYRGVDPKTAELAIIDMIDGVVQGTLDPRNALRLTSEKIAQTIQAPRTQ